MTAFFNVLNFPLFCFGAIFFLQNTDSKSGEPIFLKLVLNFGL